MQSQSLKTALLDESISSEDEHKLDNLIRQFKLSLNNNGKNAPSTKMLASQIMLAFVGVFAGFLYLDPAKTCAESACQDDWLAKPIPPQIVRQYLYFLSGFVGFASTNCTFSYYGPPKFVEMLENMNSRLVKFFATGGVISFMLMQDLQIYLAAKGTGSSALSLTMTVTGSLPGAVYGSTGLVAGLPNILSRIKNQTKMIYYNCNFAHLSETQQQELIKSVFYQHQRKMFNAMITAKWKDVVAHACTRKLDDTQDPLSFLLENDALPQTESWFKYGTRKLTQFTLGGTLTAAFSIPILTNTYSVLGESIENPTAQMLATGLLSATLVYSNASLIKKAVNTTLDAIYDKLYGKPINSLVFQLRPYKTIAIAAASTATAVFSYAVIDMLFQNMWPSTNNNQFGYDAQSVARGIARAGIDIYHLVGPLDVGTQILFRRILSHGTPEEKFLARLQLMVTYLTAELSQSDFIQQVSNELGPDDRQKIGVISWQEFIDNMKQVPEINKQERIRQMGLERFTDEVMALTKSTVEMSATTQLQSQSRYTLLSPKSQSATSAISSEDPLEEKIVIKPAQT